MASEKAEPKNETLSPTAYVQALAEVPDHLSGSHLEEILRGDDPPPWRILNGHGGIVTYPGFTDDEESRRAKAWLDEKLLSYSSTV